MLIIYLVDFCVSDHWLHSVRQLSSCPSVIEEEGALHQGV